MDELAHAQTIAYDDAWLVGGARTPFADYNGTLREVSATDLGIKAAREALKATGVSPDKIDAVVTASVAQTSFDAFFIARHIGLYAGVPIGVPALLVQRLCTSGFEAILQAADQLALGKSKAVLCVGTESMSRNPIAAYTHRGGFRMGQVEFKDFLWEATLDTAPKSRMGDTAEELAKRYQITREDTDAFAAASFERAIAAREAGFFEGEVVPVTGERFERAGYATREIRLPRKVAAARGRRASAADAARGAEGAQARLQGRADRRQQLGHRRWRRRRGRGRQRLQRGSTALGRLRASSPARRSACRRRSWGSGRRRRSAPCSPRPA